MARFIIFLVLTFFLFSCKESNNREGDKYKIISLFYKNFAKPTDLVYDSNVSEKPYSKRDSIHIDSLYESVKTERSKSKFVVAVYPQFVPYTGGHYKYYSNKCGGYDAVMNTLLILKDTSQIDLSKIVYGKKDSIIPFTNDLLVKQSKDFIRFDLLVTFSPIAFNKSYNKAIVVVTEMRSKIAGTTDLYMLEKKKGKWLEYCKINLGIY